MLDATSQERMTDSQTTYLVRQDIHQLGLCIRSAISEMLLEVIPDTFVVIQFRCICRKTDQMKAACTKQEFLDWITAVYLAIVPQDNHMPRDLT